MSRGKNGLRLGSLKYMLELTSRCNLRCGMCPMDVLTRPFEDAPFGMVEDVARQMKDLKLPMRYLHEMGEPFLYKRLPEMVSALREEYREVKGVTLKEFHDAFVSQGGLPIPLVLKILFR